MTMIPHERLKYAVLGSLLFIGVVFYSVAIRFDLQRLQSDTLANLPEDDQFQDLLVTPTPTDFPLADATYPVLTLELQQLEAVPGFSDEFTYNTAEVVRVDSQGRFLGIVNQFPETESDAAPNANVYEADTATRSTDSLHILYYFSADNKYVARVTSSITPDNKIQTFEYAIGPNDNKFSSLRNVATYRIPGKVTFTEFIGIRNGKLLIFETADTCGTKEGEEYVCDGYEYSGKLFEVSSNGEKRFLSTLSSNLRVMPESTLNTEHTIFIEAAAGGGPYHILVDLKKKTYSYYRDTNDLYNPDCYAEPIALPRQNKVLHLSCTDRNHVTLLLFDPEIHRSMTFSSELVLPNSSSMDLFSLSLDDSSSGAIIIKLSSPRDSEISTYAFSPINGSFLWGVPKAVIEKGTNLEILLSNEKLLLISPQTSAFDYDRITLIDIDLQGN